MSVESTYKNRIDINLNHNNSLQSTLSQRERLPVTQHSLKSPSRECYRERSKSRPRTVSVSSDSNKDTIVELTSRSSIKVDHQHDKRNSELKVTGERHDQSCVERRNSTPQLHLSALFQNPFRNQKHHHKPNTKDDTNATNITGNNVNASVAISSNHFADTMATKVDPSFTMRSSLAPVNGSRLITSKSSERLISSQNEDSMSSSSFVFEENQSEPRSTELFIIESHTPICVSEIYHDHFFEYFHINYYGEFDHEGPFIASLRCSYPKSNIGDICEARAIVRTPYRNCNVSDIVNGSNENNILQMLFNKANLPPIHSYGTIGDPKANEKIYLFDKANDERFNCKIGVIYQRSNQTDEYSIFSNDYIPTDMSDFLNILAKPVPLKGFQKYRGDLDTKDDLHGEYSYYREYDSHEIMFNVAPLVPSTKANGQCIERKGLVGNAFVCVVFQEPDAVFSPAFISGKVTQIYITVQPMKGDNETYYQIGLWRRNDITSVIDPPGGIYKSDEAFVSYFLTLLLNAVNIAIESPSLRSRIYEQRQRIKYEELKKLSHLFSLGPIPDFSSDIDSIHSQMDTRSNTRTESFASNTTVATSDSANTNPGRTSPVSSKKKGFSRKLFGVFSSRTGSISSPIVLPTHMNNDGLINGPQASSIADTITAFARPSIPSNKETTKPPRSAKTTQAPTIPTRSVSSQIPQIPQTTIQPPTPAAAVPNPLITDSLTQNYPLNTAALNVTLRNRSNSSPEDTVNTNKSLSLPTATINEVDTSSATSEDEESEEETSEDDNALIIHENTLEK